MNEMLITNLEDLCKTGPIFRAKKVGSNLDMAKFTADLNDFIHGAGDWGYEDAERYNLRSVRPYTKTEAQELLDHINETLQVDKYDVRIEEIDEIPNGIASELAKESGARSVSGVWQGDIRYGVLRGHELVGYVCGETENDLISISGLYVRNDYRKKGLSLGRKMLMKMMGESESKGLNGITLNHATWPGQNAVRRLKEHYDSIGRTEFDLDTGSIDLRDYAELTKKTQQGVQ
jgi:ribosomal protein S18 acetylase RimI-like enzyme